MAIEIPYPLQMADGVDALLALVQEIEQCQHVQLPRHYHDASAMQLLLLQVTHQKRYQQSLPTRTMRVRDIYHGGER